MYLRTELFISIFTMIYFKRDKIMPTQVQWNIMWMLIVISKNGKYLEFLSNSKNYTI